MRQNAIKDYVPRNSSSMNSSPFRSNLYILSSFRITFIGSSRNNVGEALNKLSCAMRKPIMWFLDTSDTNGAVQALKVVIGWKF